MKQELGWIKIAGILSILPCAYFWLSMAAVARWKADVPGDPFLIMLCVLLSIPLSIFAAIRWTRWMYVATLAQASTILLVGFRLH
jgi:hypothetical protein